MNALVYVLRLLAFVCACAAVFVSGRLPNALAMCLMFFTASFLFPPQRFD